MEVPGYRELAPPQHLRGVVECVWVRVSSAPGKVRIVPDACTDVIWQQGIGTIIAGPDTGAKLVNRELGDVLVGMRLLPGVAGNLFGVPIDALRDLRVEAGEVDPRFQLDPETPPLEVVRHFGLTAAQAEPDPLVSAATKKLADRSVASLCKELGISERQLRRRFHAATGYGPRALARILRFSRLVAALDAGRTDLARLAHELGYADQSHLTREVRRLSGLPPRELIQARGILPDGTPSGGFLPD